MLDPASLQVLISRLTGIAEEMGAVLQRAAFSPNIKERADCSAALFTAGGELLVQAEHIPVHLGSMPAAVRAALDACGDARRAGRPDRAERPVRWRHAPERRHARGTLLRRRDDRGVGREPRPSRGPRRDGPGLDASGRDPHRPGRPAHPACRPVRRRRRGDRGQLADAGGAPRRSRRAGGGEPARGRAPRGAGRRAVRRDRRLRRAPHAWRARRTAGRALAGRGRARLHRPPGRPAASGADRGRGGRRRETR